MVLDLLKEKSVKGTFFINGKNFGNNIEKSEKLQKIIKREYAEGHIVGSHTFYHKDCFPAYEDGTLKENIERIQENIEKLIHKTPRFFRPPEGQGGFSEEYCKAKGITYDSRTEIIRGILGGDGYRYGPDYGDYDYDIITWSSDPKDWLCDEDKSFTYKDSIAEFDKRMAKSDPTKDSFIILVHDAYKYSATKIIPEIIDHARNLGYEFVPLSECIGREPYRDITSDESEKKNEEDDDKESEKKTTKSTTSTTITTTKTKTKTKSKTTTTTTTTTSTTSTTTTTTTTTNADTKTKKEDNSAVEPTTNPSTNANPNNVNANPPVNNASPTNNANTPVDNTNNANTPADNTNNANTPADNANPTTDNTNNANTPADNANTPADNANPPTDNTDNANTPAENTNNANPSNTDSNGDEIIKIQRISGGNSTQNTDGSSGASTNSVITISSILICFITTLFYL